MKMSAKEARRAKICSHCHAGGAGIYGLRYRRDEGCPEDYWRFIPLCERCAGLAAEQQEPKSGALQYDVAPVGLLSGGAVQPLRADPANPGAASTARSGGQTA